MRIAIEDGGEAVVVAADGRLTASQAGRLHAALLEAFAAGRPVRLRLHEVGEADLTLLQLICAACRTAVARGVAFTLEGASEPAVARLIGAAGAGDGAGCAGGCPWDGWASGRQDAAAG